MQRLGRGQANVLHRHAHDAPRHVHGVLARLQHAPQPVERGVHVRVAHALVQRGDDVVVLLALLVVEQHAPLQRLGRNLLRDAPVRLLARECRRHIQRIERVARVAAGIGRDRGQRVVIRAATPDAPRPRASSPSARAATHDLRLAERLKRVDAAAREQRGVQLERRVLRGRADQPDRAALHIGQKRVLLRLVEAMDLIDEEDRAAAVIRRPPPRRPSPP